MNKVVVVSLNNKHRSHEKEIKTITQKLLRLLKKENCYLEIFLINSRKMRILNKKFRSPARKQASYGAGKNKTPSILSFAEPQNFPHPESKFRPLGEIYLNAEVSSFKFQVSSLLVHGLLHLIGFQHQKKSDRIKMEKLEQLVIKKLSN